MPKTKTHAGLSKRVKKTAKGKIVSPKHVGMRHNLGKKTTKQKRRLGKAWQISKADQRRIRTLLS